MMKVLWKETTFPRCKATDNHWNRKPIIIIIIITTTIIITSSKEIW